LPVFIKEGKNIEEKIESMPKVHRYSIDRLLWVAEQCASTGISAMALFPVNDYKTEDAREAYNPNNLTCRAIAAVKKRFPSLGIICDIALDPYTTHGHDGLVKDGKILNDKTVTALCKQALASAEAGTDIIAPSDMMDGRILALRKALNGGGFGDVGILSYAAKYASNFYFPFRDAIGSVSCDKSSYQLDIGNSGEAMREIAQDAAEGADMIIIKPGMPYLDILKNASKNFALPILVYQVSGEYAMLQAAFRNGWLDEKKTMREVLLGFKRAGATAIFTYAALEAAKYINDV
jgi:porphobilinogen synthase